MTQKLDKLSSGILDFLEKNEPNRFRWTEICEGLWPLHKYVYKNQKSFGAAISPKLNVLVASGSVIMEDCLYGTPNSKPIGQKPLNEVKSSRFGFFEWLNRRAERKRQEREREYAEIDREIRECQYRRACNHAEDLLREDDPELLVKCDKIRLEKRREYSLDDA